MMFLSISYSDQYINVEKTGPMYILRRCRLFDSDRNIFLVIFLLEGFTRKKYTLAFNHYLSHEKTIKGHEIG